MCLVLRRNTRAVVLDVQRHRVVVVAPGADMNFGPGRGMDERVLQQDAADLADALLVGTRQDGFFPVGEEDVVAAAPDTAELPDQGAGNLLEIDRRQLDPQPACIEA